MVETHFILEWIKTTISNIRFVVKDQHDEIIPRLRDYTMDLQMSDRKQMYVRHKCLELITENGSETILWTYK
jgi:hypothetical protein